MSDHDEVVGEASGESFCSAEAEIGEGALEGAEGGAVDRMDDDGDAGLAGGYPAEKAGFAAMGMDDVGLLLFEVPGELLQGAGIVPWVDGAYKGGDYGQESGDAGDLGFE